MPGRLSPRVFWFKKKAPRKSELQLGADVPFEWVSNGHFSLPDWGRVKIWVLDRYPQEQLPDVAAALARVWLQRLRAEAGSGFHVDETEHFLVLSAFSPTKTKMLGSFSTPPANGSITFWEILLFIKVRVPCLR